MDYEPWMMDHGLGGQLKKQVKNTEETRISVPNLVLILFFFDHRLQFYRNSYQRRYRKKFAREYGQPVCDEETFVLYDVDGIWYFPFFLSVEGPCKRLFSINTADKPPYSTPQNTGVYDQIISHIFKALEIQIQINHLPSARSIENVDIGLDDAEYARIKGLSQNHKNIRIVDEKLIDFEFTAFSKNPEIEIHGWDSLSAYNVAFMRGWKIYEKNVTRTKSLLIVPSEKEMFQLLENGRVDIILYERLRGFSYMRDNTLSGIYRLVQPLSTRGMYIYVNRRHIALIPKIEAALRKFKASEQYQDIIDSAFK